MSSRILLTTPFLAWGIINLFVGIWEVYVFRYRNDLRLESRTVWEKIANKEITISNFWIEGWSEYCKVDSRYIHHQYVWGFELVNAILAFVFILALILESKCMIILILTISIINCILYFATLLLEYFYNRLDINYAKWWQFPIYYFISSIWIIIPYYLYLRLI
jgi:hypothetical protein